MARRVVEGLTDSCPTGVHSRGKILASIILLAGALTPVHASALGDVGHRLTTKNETQQAQQDIRALETGKPVERQLVGDEAHIYELALVSNWYLHLVVDQKGVDVVVAVLTPRRKQILEVDSPTGTEGLEEAFLVTEEPGIYRIEVKGLDKSAPPGKYRIWIEESREARPEDGARVAGEKKLADAELLRAEGTASSKRKSIETYEEALVLLQAAGRPERVAATLFGMGQAYHLSGERKKALDCYDRALPLFRAAGDRESVSKTLANIGAAWDSLGQWQKALDHYNQALELRRSVGGRSEEAKLLSNIGWAYNSLGEKQRALDFLNQALPITKEAGDRDGEATVLNNLGGVYTSLGNKQKALEYYNQVLSIMRAMHNTAGERITLSNMGAVYYSLGEKEKALEYLNQALSIFKAVGDRAGEAITLNNIGLIYDSLGETQKALDHYNSVLAIKRALGDAVGEAVTLHNIGAVYDSIGAREKALDYYNEALPIRKAAGDAAGEAAILNNIGRVYNSLGETDKAFDYFNRALSIRRTVGDVVGEAITLNNIGNVHLSLGDSKKALDSYNQALPTLVTAGERALQAQTLTNIAEVYHRLGENQKALDQHDQALRLSQAVHERSLEATNLYGMARIFGDRGNLVEAQSRIEAALSIIESLRSKIVFNELRSSFLSSTEQYYEFYIDVLMRLHKVYPAQGYSARALQASERARARSLLDTLSEGLADIRRGVDRQLLEQERSLQKRLNASAQRQTQLMSGNHTEEQATALAKEIEELIARLQEVETEIKAGSPGYALLTQPSPLSFSEIQQVLDSNTLLLEYSLGNDCSYVWLASTDSLLSFELPGRVKIESAARRVYDLLTSRGQSYRTTPERREALARADALYPEAAAALSQMLLGPVADRLSGKRLLIVAEGALQYIPFGALPAPLPHVSGQENDVKQRSSSRRLPLIADHEIVSLPSASVLAVLRRETAGRARAANLVAVIADPVFDRSDPRLGSAALKPESGTGTAAPLSESQGRSTASSTLQRSADDTGFAGGRFSRLPSTRLEARYIVALSPAGTALRALDFDANKTTATSPELANYQIVHFATHALLNNRHPELSGLVLSLVDRNGEQQDGFLRLHDIYNLNLSADMVVLSACRTALGKGIKREGIVGLTRGFMYAGASRVMASLWKVDDDATAELMRLFYDRKLRAGLSPAAALRSAELSMLKQGAWKSPFYWAGFVIYGEWK